MELRKTGFMIRSRWHLPCFSACSRWPRRWRRATPSRCCSTSSSQWPWSASPLRMPTCPARRRRPPEGDILRRVTFSPAQRPTLRMSPALGRWDWSAADYVSLRIQNAMSWDMTLEVAIEGEQGAPGLQASIELPAGRRRPCWCRCGRFRQRLWACVRGRRCHRWSKASGCCWRHAWRARWTAPGSER